MEFTGVTGLTRGLAAPPPEGRPNQEPLVVKDEVGRLPGELIRGM